MAEPDRLMLAWISGITGRYCGRGVIDDLDAAVAELRNLTGTRTDLLAEHAGICLGFAEEGLELLAPQHRARAELCIAAGAPRELIEPWIVVGRKRAAASCGVPFTGVGHSH